MILMLLSYCFFSSLILGLLWGPICRVQEMGPWNAHVPVLLLWFFFLNVKNLQYH